MSRLAKGGSGLILGLLLIAYTLNFLDRQIVSILKIPIKAELGLSDTQLGLMGGIAFASVYSTLAIPFARYADRKGRARVIVLAVATWSLFTALCGLVTSFWQLFLARMGVGVGEAGGVGGLALEVAGVLELGLDALAHVEVGGARRQAAGGRDLLDGAPVELGPAQQLGQRHPAAGDRRRAVAGQRVGDRRRVHHRRGVGPGQARGQRHLPRLEPAPA